MPIRIPEQLPAQNVLLGENIFTMESNRAANQDIRPLKVGILNLMPNKIETEVVLANLGDSVDFEKLITSLKNQFGV